MGLNATPLSERVHIGIFGSINAGKSSIINAITGQDAAIVSDYSGTTTDPVYKSMELLPLGPVVLIDTPGLDDKGELGQLRVEKSHRVLEKTDIAVIVLDASVGLTEDNRQLIERIEQKGIPYILAMNKSDVPGASDVQASLGAEERDKYIFVSAKTGEGIHELKEKIAALAPKTGEKKLIADLLNKGDMVILVVPIDASAPKGRLILPQQQVIRDVLEAYATSVVIRETEVAATIKALGTKPRLVVTDSQAFKTVSEQTPLDIPLTSFSILFARYKGNLGQLVEVVRKLDNLKDGDKVLISEGCTHHRQCEDIGTVKLPNWIKKHTNKEINYEFTSGGHFPTDLSDYDLIIHCGACMLNEKEVQYRLAQAKEQGVPMTNYGTAIAHMHGILDRALAPFKDYGDI